MLKFYGKRFKLWNNSYLSGLYKNRANLMYFQANVDKNHSDALQSMLL